MISTGLTWDVGNLHDYCGSLCFGVSLIVFTAHGISSRNNDDTEFSYAYILILGLPYDT